MASLPRTIVVALTGSSGAGKDTVAQALQLYVNSHKVVTLSFAAALKRSAEALLKMIGVCDVELQWFHDRRMKETPLDELSAHSLPARLAKITPRRLLQLFGTGVCRTHISPRVWVDAALDPLYTHLREEAVAAPPTMFVITDMRFPNELEIVSSLPCDTVCLVRKEGGYTTHGHISEASLANETDVYESSMPWFPDAESVVGASKALAVSLGATVSETPRSNNK